MLLGICTSKMMSGSLSGHWTPLILSLMDISGFLWQTKNALLRPMYPGYKLMVLLFAAATMTHLGALQHLALQFPV